MHIFSSNSRRACDGDAMVPRTAKTRRPALLRGLASAAVLLFLTFTATGIAQTVRADGPLSFTTLPEVPNPIGVAGPLVGICEGGLIVAGGANFAAPDDPRLWQVSKRFHDRIWLLQREANGFRWRTDLPTGRLRNPVAYSAVVHCDDGILCFGGEDADGPKRRCFLLRWRADRPDQPIEEDDAAVPDLPQPSTAGGAAILGDYVYLFTGQTLGGDGSPAPSNQFWRFPLSAIGNEADVVPWEALACLTDGPSPRTHAIVVSQAGRLFLVGGRRIAPNTDASDPNHVTFFQDVWSFDPQQYDPHRFDRSSGAYRGQSPWRREADAPVPLAAGTALPMGKDQIAVLSYDDGSQIRQAIAAGQTMETFPHPGFPQQGWIYHVSQQRWNSFATPANQVTTPAVAWRGAMFLISGEIRPRVRTRQCWMIAPTD